MKFAMVLVAMAFSAAMAACGGGDEGGGAAPSMTASSASSYSVKVASTDRLALGPARFVFLLQNARGQPVPDARVHVEFFFIDPVRNNRKTLKFGVDAMPIELAESHVLTRTDGTSITLGPGPTGVYANAVAFDQPGDWIVDINGSDGNNNLGRIEVALSVSETAVEPRPGSPAPALDAGPAEGPLMVVFGTPGVCHAEVCGPLAEIASEVASQTGLRAEFVAFEESEATRFPAWAEDWNVGPEPSVFFIDSSGIVRGRIDAIAAYGELEALALTVLP
jgi:hypothetical protein